MISEETKKQFVLEAADAIDRAVDRDQFVREHGLHRNGEDALLKLARALRALVSVEQPCTGSYTTGKLTDLGNPVWVPCQRKWGHEGNCGPHEE